VTTAFAAAFAIIAVACLGILVAQTVAMRLFLRARPIEPPPGVAPGISILKPLAGIDDDLARNLAQFAELEYPAYEVVLGVRDAQDAAYKVAEAAVARWPDRMRLVVQKGEPGLNPKVNQLITLTQAARHEIVLVSDSNVRVPPGYLAEIAAHFLDPTVGLVTNPVVGVGEQRLGSLLDNLHMTAGITAGALAAKKASGHDLVIGKSMALRKADLAAMGGWEATKDVLAEDHLMGKWTTKVLGKRVAFCRRPVFNVTQKRKVVDFLRRYQRWSVMQHAAVGHVVYFSQIFLQPIFFALLAFLALPSLQTAAFLALVTLVKVFVDGTTMQALRGESLAPAAWFAIPLKDLSVTYAWAYGLTHDTVNWRGNELKVLAGTRLANRRRVRNDELEESAAAAGDEAQFLAADDVDEAPAP